MKRTYLVLIIVGVIAIALFSHFQSLSIRREREKEAAGLMVKIQPQGELEDFPDEMIFRFREPFPGAEGVVIPPESIRNFLRIEPELKTSGHWVSEQTFELKLSGLRPDQWYEVTLFRIPLVSQEESIPPQQVRFRTPPFAPLTATLVSLRRGEAEIAVEFNLPPDPAGIGEFIQVVDSRRKEVRISSITPVRDNKKIILLKTPVLRAPQQYQVVLKKGLISDQGFPLTRDFSLTVPIGFPANPLGFNRYEIEESEEGYLVTIRMSTLREPRCEIDEEGLKQRIRIRPQLPFQVSASGRNIFIFADFIPKKSYEITLKAGIRTKKKSRLLSDHKFTLTVPEPREVLRFLYQGRYFGKAGSWRLPVRVSQLDTLRLSIIYMPPANLLFWHRKDWGRKWSIHSYGEPVISDRLIPIEASRTRVVWIDLKEYLPTPAKGVYLVQVEGRTRKKRYLSDRIAVVISDLGLVVKWSGQVINVWAFDTKTMEPVENVDIEVRSRKNFITGSGRTDGTGFTAIPIQKKGRDVYLVTATKGKEWTYLLAPDLRLAREDFDVAGEDPEIPYLGYLYPERDLYRPGEEVHFAVVVREPRTYHGVSIPIRVLIRDPKGSDCLALTGRTDESGLARFTFPTSPSAPTGKYLLILKAGERTLHTGAVFVETFVPERMRVELKIPEEPDIYTGFPIELSAEYLFGAPASGEEYRIRLAAEEIRFRAPGYYGYAFGPYRTDQTRIPSYRMEPVTGELDNEGRAKVMAKVDPSVVFQGPVQLTINATVSEGASGRVTSKTITRTVHLRPFYIGLRSDHRRIFEDSPIRIKGVLLRPDGSLYKKKTGLRYRIYRLSWSYSYHYYEDYSWDERLQRIPVTELKRITARDGKFSFTFTPKSSYHDYLIEVVDPSGLTLTQLRLAGWGWWYEEEKVESPEVVRLRLNKKVYEPGDLVEVEALLPFEGKILWTVELDSIYRSELTEAKGEVARWSFRAPSGLSTVYVSALLLRSGGNYLIQRGFGLERVRIRPGSVRLGLKLDLPERIRPGEELVIRVKGSERFEGTIAVVDEGILQITNFTTPDPYERILRDLRLLINTAESFGWIVRKFLEKTGGGLYEREEEFPQPRFARIVSFWSGILKSDGKGRLTYRVQIPPYHGRLRVMVAGVNESRLGSAEGEVVVRSDVVITPTIPRFLHTEDRFSFPITLINTTPSSRETRLQVKLTGARIGRDRFTVKLPPQGKETVWIEGRALDLPGSVTIEITGRTGSERYQESFEIPLYPNLPYITGSEYLEVKPGRTDLSPHFQDWYPRAHLAHLILAPIPALSRLNHLRYVIHYPYGCIEQTSTSTFLLLNLSPLLPVIDPELSQARYQDMVNSGIRRIISMQTPSGGFAFWPGGGRPQPWASGYATLVLIEAKEAGFFIPKGVIDAALNYLDALPEKSGFIYYVLARGGHLARRPTVVDRLVARARKEEFAIPSGLWICGAIHFAGRTGAAGRCLEAVLKKRAPVGRRYSGDFYSQLQYQGMTLYLLLSIDPEHEAVADLLTRIATALAGRSYYYTTQELAWCLAGIGQYARKVRGEYQAKLRVDGKLRPAKEKNGIFAWHLKNCGGKRVELELKSGSPLFLGIENTGFSRKVRSFQPVFNRLYLERRLYSYTGKPVSSARTGDLLVMRVRVRGSGYYQ
ncbi:hypothetical protein DRP53_01195, partial [candidate division WOR-3 bacterium]